MKSLSLLAACILLSSCVSKEQYRTLAESYKAYHEQTSTVYLDHFDSAPSSVKNAKRNDVAAAKAAWTNALEAAK